MANSAKSGAMLTFMWIAGLVVLGFLIYAFWPGNVLFPQGILLR